MITNSINIKKYKNKVFCFFKSYMILSEVRDIYIMSSDIENVR